MLNSGEVFLREVCIGICAYNEEKNIGSLLNNLLTEQDLPKNTEVIVVCSGCTDRTEDIVKYFSDRDRRVKLIVEKERRGKASAVNMLLKHAGSEIIVMPAADTLPAVGAIQKIISFFYDKKVGVAGGQPKPVNQSVTPASLTVDFIWFLHHNISLYEMRNGSLWHPSGELWAIRSRLVKAIPANTVNDDTHIGLLAKRSGFKVVYVPDAVTYIKGPGNLRDLLKQRRRIAVGHMQIKKDVGMTVSTTDPRVVFSSLVRAILNESRPETVLKRFLGTILGVVLEIVACLLARYDFMKNNIPYKWDTISSTKDLVSRAST